MKIRKYIWQFIGYFGFGKSNTSTVYNLFLDDVRMPVDAFNYTKDTDFLKMKWTIVRNYKEFVEYITKMYECEYFIEFISLDHDLADEHMDYYINNGGYRNPPNPINVNFTEKTGMDCAKWLVDFCIDNKLKLPKYKVHSQNPCGKENILSLLNNFKKFQEKENA